MSCATMNQRPPCWPSTKGCWPAAHAGCALSPGHAATPFLPEADRGVRGPGPRSRPPRHVDLDRPAARGPVPPAGRFLHRPLATGGPGRDHRHAHQPTMRARATGHYLRAVARPALRGRARLGESRCRPCLRRGNGPPRRAPEPAPCWPRSARPRCGLLAGQVWVASGDYFVSGAGDDNRPRFEPVRCHAFITESTFGLPIYRWRPQRGSFVADIDAWWAAKCRGRPASVLYSVWLGRSACWTPGSTPRSGRFTCGAVGRSTRPTAPPACHCRPPPGHQQVNDKTELAPCAGDPPPSVPARRG